MKELWPVGFLKSISHTVQPLAVYLSCSQNLCLIEHKSRMCYSVSYTCTFIFSSTYSFIFTTIYFTCRPALLSRTNDTCTSDSLTNASSRWFLNWWVVKLPEELGKITKRPWTHLISEKPRLLHFLVALQVILTPKFGKYRLFEYVLCRALCENT